VDHNSSGDPCRIGQTLASSQIKLKFEGFARTIFSLTTTVSAPTLVIWKAKTAPSRRRQALENERKTGMKSEIYFDDFGSNRGLAVVDGAGSSDLCWSQTTGKAMKTHVGFCGCTLRKITRSMSPATFVTRRRFLTQ
jgi:hypothetical protein